MTQGTGATLRNPDSTAMASHGKLRQDNVRTKGNGATLRNPEVQLTEGTGATLRNPEPTATVSHGKTTARQRQGNGKATLGTGRSGIAR